MTGDKEIEYKSEIDPKQRSWRRDYLERKAGLSAFQIQLLNEGPKKLTDAWALGAMRKDWEDHFQTCGIID